MHRRGTGAGRRRLGLRVASAFLVVAAVAAFFLWPLLSGGGDDGPANGDPSEYPLEAGYAAGIRYVWTKSFVVAADVRDGAVSTALGPPGAADPGGYNYSDDPPAAEGAAAGASEGRWPFREQTDRVTPRFVGALLRALDDPRRTRRVVVYVTTEALGHFVRTVLPRLHERYAATTTADGAAATAGGVGGARAAQRSFVLVTGCTDPGPLLALERIPGPGPVSASEPASALLQRLLGSPLLHAWFAQNCDVAHAKLRCIPIGLDFHSQATRRMWWGGRISPYAQDGQLATAAAAAKPWAARPAARVYMDFSSHSNRALRGRLYWDFFAKAFTSYSLRSLRRDELWQRYGEFAFVLSPPGNGYDCHRTWEALALGATPIVLASAAHASHRGVAAADALFEGLPVVVVQSYEEVTEDALRRWHAEIGEKRRAGAYRLEKLTNAYWIAQMRAAAVEGIDAQGRGGAA